MRLSGVIYDASSGNTSGAVIIESGSPQQRAVPRVSLEKRRVVRRAGLLPSTFLAKLARLDSAKLGTIFLVVSLLGLLSIFGPILKQEIKPPTGGPDAYSYFGDLLKKNPLGFSLLIPKINLRAKIIPNVDPNDQSAYEKALEQGIAHSQGSVFPGMKGNIYLFSRASLSNSRKKNSFPPGTDLKQLLLLAAPDS